MDRIKSIKCYIIGLFGNLVCSPLPAIFTEFEKNLEAADKNLNTHKYDAGHGIVNPINPSFNARDSSDAYEKAIYFLKSH
jgi:dienelactone hydrolase